MKQEPNRTPQNRKEPEREGSHSSNVKRGPYRVRLPGLISDEEVGLGDVIKRTTTGIGIPPCGGCSRRASALNRWIVFYRL